MHTTPTTSPPPVTLRHTRDSRRVARSDSDSTPTKSLERRVAPALGSAEGAALREGFGEGPAGWDKPDAARLHEEPGASRRPPGAYSDAEFRRLCVLVRAELKAHAGLDGPDLMEHLKCACARRRLAYDSAVLGRVLDVVTPRKRVVQRHAEPPRTHWRDRCAHTPTCATPTACALATAKETR